MTGGRQNKPFYIDIIYNCRDIWLFWPICRAIPTNSFQRPVAFSATFLFGKLKERNRKMKKSLLLLGAVCLFANQANATNISPYVSAKIKYSFMDNSAKATAEDDTYMYQLKFDADDNVFGGSVAAGILIPVANSAFRTEIEYSKNSDAEKTHHYYGESYKAKVESQSLLANVYYDFNTGTKFTPYIGAGIGGTKLKASLDGDSVDDKTFTWQIGAGTAYALTENLSLDIGYRFINYGDFSETETDVNWWEKDKVESKAHEIYAGIRYSF